MFHTPIIVVSTYARYPCSRPTISRRGALAGGGWDDQHEQLHLDASQGSTPWFWCTYYVSFATNFILVFRLQYRSSGTTPALPPPATPFPYLIVHPLNRRQHVILEKSILDTSTPSLVFRFGESIGNVFLVRQSARPTRSIFSVFVCKTRINFFFAINLNST